MKFQNAWFSALLKIIAALGISIFIWRAAEYMLLARTFNWSLLVLVLGEVLTIAIVLLARPAKDYDFSPIAIISTVMASFYFVLVVLGNGTQLISQNVAAIGQTLGICWQIWAKLYLGRSFGLLPANRGIVSTGPYRIVRHPIYFGYFLNHIFFLLGNFSLHNLFLYGVLYFLQGIRIWKEESLLRKDPEYLAYMQKTRFRFIPGLF